MGLRDWLLGGAAKPMEVQVAVKAQPARGHYSAARYDNTAYAALEASHKEIQRDLTKLREKSRGLYKDNAYARRYHNMVATHIVGSEGVILESTLTGNKNKPKAVWNEEIEAGWKDWGSSVTTDGELDWVAFQQLVATTVSVDGEVLVRVVRGYPHNRFGFALELIDADRLDWTWNLPTDSDGSRTVMGIKLDKWGRALGYWIWSAHPMDFEGAPKRQFIDAKEIVHIYCPERINNRRGIPWTTPVMIQIGMLGSLWQSELESAVAVSRTLGIVKSSNNLVDPNEPTEDPVADTVANADAITSDESRFLAVDPGLDISWGPNQHPNPALNGFSTELLTGISTGLGVAYHSLTGDVSRANYSSARVALIEERDNWTKLQGWFIARCCTPIFDAWLENAVQVGAVKVPVVDYRRAYSPQWFARSWEWIDPSKDADASIKLLASGLSSYQEELGSLGKNWKKVLTQRAEEQKFIQELGLNLDLGQKTSPASGAIETGAPLPTAENSTNPLVSGGNDATK